VLSADWHHTTTNRHENVTQNGGYARIRTYRRHVGLPLSLSDLLPIGGLSPTQLTLILALLHQQA
jgi:hypothetical protein